MDIEKLIVSLRSPSWQDLEDPELAHFPFDEPGIGERTRLMAENAELRAELEQVKRENETLKHALQNWHEEV